MKDSNNTADRPEGKLPPGQPGTDEQVSAGAGDKSEDESSEASLGVPVLSASSSMTSSEAGLRFVCPCWPCSATRQHIVLLMNVSKPLLCPAGHEAASSSAAGSQCLTRPSLPGSSPRVEGATHEVPHPS